MTIALHNAAPRRAITDYTKVQATISAAIRCNPFQATRLNLAAKPYLNAGCGDEMPANFVNLDYHWKPGVDLCWDLTRSLPFADRSLEGVFSHHCLEHLTADGGQQALADFRRVLKPGSVARIVVPDTEWLLDLYARNKHLAVVGEPTPGLPGYQRMTPMEAVNSLFRDDCHLYAYDFTTLAKAMRTAGFRDVTKQAYRKGSDQQLLQDRPAYAGFSLYVEGVA